MVKDGEKRKRTNDNEVKILALSFFSHARAAAHVYQRLSDVYIRTQQPQK
jgi:hypothetical protein